MRSRARRVDPMIRRITRALAAALTACALVAAPLAAGASAEPAHDEPAHAEAIHAASSERSAASGTTLSVAVAGGGVARPGQDLVATATITNAGASALPSGTITVWIDDSGLDSRAELHSWLQSDDQDARARTLAVSTTNRLEPGSSVTFHVVVPAASVALDAHTATEVFGFGATLADSAGATVVDRGSLVWYPGGATASTNVAVAIPITTPATSNGLISSKDLATYTGANGLLTRQVDGLLGHPSVAIGLDPRILASIRVLGSSAPPSATAWLESLSHLPNDVFPLQFADADVAGQVQSGLKKLLSPTTLAWAMNPSDFTGQQDKVGQTPQPSTTDATTPAQAPSATPTQTGTPSSTPSSGANLPSLGTLLSWPYTMSGVAWPPDDTVRASDLPVFVANGLTTTILSGDNTTAATLKGTPDAAVKVPAGKAVASDSAVSAALRDAVAATTDADWEAAMSRVNAQLELIAQENPSSPRTILATLARAWPTDATMLPRTLQALDEEPWHASVTLSQAVEAPVTSGLGIRDQPESGPRIAAIQQLRADEAKLGAFSSVLDDPTTMTGPTRVRLLSLLGAVWLNGKNDWTAAAAKSVENTAKTLQAITIVPASNVNVASTEAPVPITVENALDKRVTIVLSAVPSNGRLEIDGSTTKTLQPDSRGTVVVPVKATLGNGHVRLTLSLHSPTGVPIGDSAVLPVQVHADWEGVGALVIGILVVLLFGFGIVRNILRHRSDRGAADATHGDTETAHAGSTRTPGGDASG